MRDKKLIRGVNLMSIGKRAIKSRSTREKGTGRAKKRGRMIKG